VEVLILKKIKKINIFLKNGIIAFVLIFGSFTYITASISSISNYEEAVNYTVEQLSIDKDEVLLYVWGPINKGKEVFSGKELIINVPEKGYIVYIDLYPRANLFHPVQYIFVSENKEEFITIDAMSPPRNFEDYIMVETEIGELLLSAQNRRATFQIEKNPGVMKKTSDSRWAVLMNGGYAASSNHVRYWNDLSNLYITLVDVYGYPDENIIVLCSDGLDPTPDQSNGQNSDPDLDGDGDDDIMYSCVLSNIDIVFADLANNLTGGNELFIFQTDHGNTLGGWDSVFNLWNMEELTDAHFAELLDALPDCEIICTFEPCFSGGFLDDVVVAPGPIVASSACSHDEYSWAMDNLIYDEYAFHWTAAVNGQDAFGESVDADFNQDGAISMDEAFIYAEANDAQPESPQYGDYPEGIGELYTLWPGSEPPETPTKPEGVETWIINVETSFSTSATDPEGEQVYYMFDWGDGNLSEWIGPYASGETGEASYTWTELGGYEIRAVAKDIHGVQSNWSEPAFISIVENEPPVKVTIEGPTWGFGGKKYDFSFVSTDADEHDIYYRIDWDDGQDTGWLGPYSTGQQIMLNHSWNQKGEYWIKAWAKDTLEEKSSQANFKFTILTNDKSKQSYQRYIDTLIILILERFPIIRSILRI
jgi:hypothetical protein